MVSDLAITGGIAIIAGAVGYAIAGWVNLQSTSKQITAQREQLETRIAAENQQRRADHYIERKVDELMHLYSVLEEVRRLYKRRADAAPYNGITSEEYDELIEKFDEYSSAMDRGMIFLDDNQQETLYHVFNILMDANGHLNKAINDSESIEPYNFGQHGLSEFNDRFNAAEEMLQEEVKGPIDALKTQ
jgi:hypothetical protein